VIDIFLALILRLLQLVVSTKPTKNEFVSMHEPFGLEHLMEIESVSVYRNLQEFTKIKWL